MRPMIVALLILFPIGAAGAPITGSTPESLKDPGPPYVNPQPPVRMTGDTFEDPFILPEGDCSAAGSTSGFINDYDEVCPYEGSTAPDVVYEFTVVDPAYVAVEVDLCYSSYDTKVYVYDALDRENPIACNDDYYFAAPCFTYSSYVWVPIDTGHTYDIVIDGYGSANGAYFVYVAYWTPGPPVGACCTEIGHCSVTTEVGCTAPSTFLGVGTDCDPNPCPPPAQVDCPAGALIENEPPCVDGNPVDAYNGGCNSVPPVFQALDPQVGACGVVCGRSCASQTRRDTDWYVSFGTGDAMIGTAVAEFPVQYLVIYGTDCTALTYLIATAEDGGPLTLEWFLEDGQEVWNWVGLSVFCDWPESDYRLEVCGIGYDPSAEGACCHGEECVIVTEDACQAAGDAFVGPGVPCVPSPCEPVPVEARSWGAIKARFGSR